MNFKEFQQKLSAISNNKIAMVGLGNPYRRDDNAGQVLLAEIRNQNLLNGSTFIFANTTPENHLEEIVAAKPEMVIFIDAVKMNKTPGEIDEIPSNRVETKGFSTHSYSIKLIEEYLQNEGVGSFMYLGIEPEDMGVGEDLTPAVRQGIESFFH